jgi:hypothetical protein
MRLFRWWAATAALALLLPGAAGASEPALRGAAATGGGYALALTDSLPLPAGDGAAYVDPLGDGADGLAPDVAGTRVWSDAAGIVTLAVSIPNVPVLRNGDAWALFLDTDENEGTGSAAAEGADYVIAADGRTRTIGLGRWRDGAWSFAAAQGSLAGAWASGPTIRIDRAELGGTTAFRFWQAAKWTNAAGRTVTDYAPSAGVWDYALPGVEALPPPPRDVTPPVVRALRSSGPFGGGIAIRYRLRDDSGETRERVRIFRRGRLLWTYFTELAPSRPDAVYWVPWEAPRGIGRRLRFCVRAWDEAGNASRRSCAPLVLRRP